MKNRINMAIILMQARADRLFEKRGESGVNTLIGVLIGIIIGGLVLVGITKIVDWLFPEITAKIGEIFGISGTTPTSSVTSV